MAIDVFTLYIEPKPQPKPTRKQTPIRRTLKQRYWDHVFHSRTQSYNDTPCLLWSGFKHIKDAQLRVPPLYTGKRYSVTKAVSHVVHYLHTGTWPEKGVGAHRLCGDQRCTNYHHMSFGTVDTPTPAETLEDIISMLRCGCTVTGIAKCYRLPLCEIERIKKDMV